MARSAVECTGGVTANITQRTAEAAPHAGLELVAARRITANAPVTWFDLRPGDRPLVREGEPVTAGTPLAEILHDRRVITVPGAAVGDGLQPGARWSGPPQRDRIGRRGTAPASGELLFSTGGSWLVATGEPGAVLEAPFAGTVHEVRPGIGIALAVAGGAICGIRAVGAPARGRLEVVAMADADVRAGGLDVGQAGGILVMGRRVDAETLTRARAMGIRGMVVGALSGRDLRDFAASEARQRAGLHRLPPFAVLVLDGAIRRALASPVRSVLKALSGREVAIVADPPQLLFDSSSVTLPRPGSDLVRVLQGTWGGREGRWAGPAGRRQFRGGVWLEAGFVSFDGAAPVALPIGDLERFV
jgi:hypothetical protein